ncbi:MAG: hypothetical protein HY788_17665 [Deltaproteobacteria bacterium]|nr:hypothetical protein [Deltaproteobacteria bacterium]
MNGTTQKLSPVAAQLLEGLEFETPCRWCGKAFPGEILTTDGFCSAECEFNWTEANPSSEKLDFDPLDSEPRSDMEEVRNTLRDVSDEMVEIRRLVLHMQCAVETSKQDNGNGGAAKSVQEVVQQDPDSLTIGTPGNGQIKVFGDFRNKVTFQKKIDDALDLLDNAHIRRHR